MKKLPAVKFAVTTVVGVGTAKIIGSIVEYYVPLDRVTDKVTVKAASMAFGGLLAERTKQYTDAKIDEIVAFVKPAATQVITNVK